jgi:hypothetical protein
LQYRRLTRAVTATPVQSDLRRGRPPLRPLRSPIGSVELQPTASFDAHAGRLPAPAIPECTRFHRPPFPWASTSFRPRHTRPTADASALPSRSIGQRATAATAACSALTKPLPPAKPPGSLQSPRAGCRRACGTLPRAEHMTCFAAGLPHRFPSLFAVAASSARTTASPRYATRCAPHFRKARP